MGLITRMGDYKINLNRCKLPNAGTKKWFSICHGGGPAPGSNAVVSGAMRAAVAHGNVGMVAFVDGFKGMMNGDAVILRPNLVSDIEREGGVFIGTSRFNPSLEQRQQMLQQLKEWGIDGGIGIGGDDTNSTVSRMSNDGFPMVGVPKTIDNDVPGTSITYGHRTVIEKTAEELRALKIDARAQDVVSAYIVSIMGRKSGSWTLEAGSAGGATAIFIPEQFSAKGIEQILSLSRTIMPRKEQLLLRISRMLEVNGQKLSITALSNGLRTGAIQDQDIKLNATLLAREIAETIANRVKADLSFGVFAVAEGIADRLPTRAINFDDKNRPIEFEVMGLGKPVTIGVDAHHNPRLSDINIEYPLMQLVREETRQRGIDVKLVPRSFGYQFRAIDPCGFDVNLALRLGQKAANLLVNNRSGRMVVTDGEAGDRIGSVDYKDLPYDETGHLVPRTVDLTGVPFIQAVNTEFYKGGMEYRTSMPPSVPSSSL